MSDRFTIRLATLDDVDAIAEHRTRMFEEMGEVPPEASTFCAQNLAIAFAIS
jgi:hypothetical protein